MFRVEGDTGERRELIAVMFKVAEEMVEGGTGYRRELIAVMFKVAEEVVEGGTGYRRELSCIVHAEPKPEVTWYKNSMLLDLGTRYKHIDIWIESRM